MTKLKCLEECLRIWAAIYDNKLWYKYDVKGADDYIHACSCCQYTLDEQVKAGETIIYRDKHKKSPYLNCAKYCPMGKYWTGRKTSKNYMCEESDSPYSKWDDSEYADDRTEYAGEIVFIVERALEDCDEDC